MCFLCENSRAFASRKPKGGSVGRAAASLAPRLAPRFALWSCVSHALKLRRVQSKQGVCLPANLTEEAL